MGIGRVGIAVEEHEERARYGVAAAHRADRLDARSLYMPASTPSGDDHCAACAQRDDRYATWDVADCLRGGLCDLSGFCLIKSGLAERVAKLGGVDFQQIGDSRQSCA